MAVPAYECDVCSAKVHELRRGRCWGCYARWVDTRPVGAGAHCVMCRERRRRMLRSVELLGGWHPMCFSCHGQLQVLAPLPATVAEIRDALSRERRKIDRRCGRPDTRVFQYERRIGQRRELRDGEWVAIDDDMVVEITIDRSASDGDVEDLTRILDRISI